MDRNESILASHNYIKFNVNIFNFLHIKGFIILPTDENGPSTLGSASDLLWKNKHYVCCVLQKWWLLHLGPKLTTSDPVTWNSILNGVSSLNAADRTPTSRTIRKHIAQS